MSPIFELLSSDLQRMGQTFRSAEPFPVLVIDNFLPAPLAEGLMKEIQANQEFQKSNDYIFAKNKFETPKIQDLGPNAILVRDSLLSPEFAAALSTLLGRKVFVDPGFVGGGLHRGGEGSFLDMHTDFNLHPRNRTWIRELNILLYLNKEWVPEHGGRLDLKCASTGRARSIDPLFNRMVVMLTKDHTLHGYKQISFPPGQYRTSIAAYAYSEAESGTNLSALRTTTTWAPEETNFLKQLIAKLTPRLVTIKQRIFGSSTAKGK